MNNIHVVNKSNHAPTNNDFYIGRGSVFGNPFTSKDLEKTKAEFQVNNKSEAIEKYDTYLRNRITNKDISIVDGLNEMLKSLENGDISLVCYCKPKECHGDVIKIILNGMRIKTLIKNI